MPTKEMFLVVILSLITLLRADVIKVTKSNFEKVTKWKKFIVLYFVPPKGYCDTCLNLYPEFLATSDIFRKEKAILFGKVSDSQLIDVLSIKLFPSVVYYNHGSAEHKPLEGDISVDNLFRTVKKGMKRSFPNLKPTYTVKLTNDSFDDCIYNPNQHSFIIVYDTESDQSELQMFEDLAATFKNDEELLIGSMNASKEFKLAADFAVSRYPTLYWYDKTDKSTRKRYGGRMDMDELITFINDQTELNRFLGGELMPTAGRLDEMDTLITMYIEDIMEGTSMHTFVEQMEEYAERFQNNKKFASYYVSLAKKIQKHGSMDVLDKERDLLTELLGKGKLTPKVTDDLKRKINILDKFFDESAMSVLHGSDRIHDPKVDVIKKQKKPKRQDLHEEL